MEGPGTRDQHFVLAGVGTQRVNISVQGGHATVRVRAFADTNLSTCDGGDNDTAAAAACAVPGLLCVRACAFSLLCNVVWLRLRLPGASPAPMIHHSVAIIAYFWKNTILVLIFVKY